MKKCILYLTIVSFLVMLSCSKDKNKPDENNNDSKPPFEIWMGLKTGSTGNWANLDWKIVLSNGDYFNQLPIDGFLNFSRNQTGGTWGTFAMNGSTGTFTNQYETIQVKKISDTELEKVGYTNHVYKLASVDGVKLSGKYNTIPNWSTIPNYPYNATEPQPMIEFTAAGTFKDLGAFVSNFSMPNQYPERAPGNGTYEIKSFTLILNYADGRKITKSFSGVFNNKITATSELVFVGGNPFYNQ
ncbi:hypothetical protein DU508_17115 [Pedobacter chinensis]|uniref:Uncharacterized protein n=1 Tax=Pedobacter chinensis TaxID=2282421 RepID=A0A369PRX9_9SPHI|nr:hypothetical protein [Pedobacter chinensis]RDC55293.1 hypothetical protein DU508_17115 [Pedobacter chinensis]